MNRRLFLHAAGVSLAGATLAAAGCTPRPTSGGAGGGAEGGTTVRAAWWGGDVRHAKFNAIYDLYSQRHEGVSIAREFADYGSYFERLPTQFAGGNAPDLLHVTERQVSDYASRGQLADLRSFADGGPLDLSLFSEASLAAGEYQGTLVMLLVGATIPATMYNAALFAQAGVAEPGLDWTWDAFASACLELAANLPEGSLGSTYQAISAPTFETTLVQDGKSLFAPDASAQLNFDAADGERWFRLWKELLDAGGCQTAEQTAEDSSAPFEDTAFAQGNTAMHVQNSNQLVTFQTAVGEAGELALAPFPQVGGAPASLVIGSYVSINANATDEVAEEAASIVDFFVNDPDANRIFGLELGVPGNSNWVEAVEAELEPVDRKVLEFAQAVEAQSVFATPRPSGSSRADSLMSELGLAVGFGELDPAAAGARLVDELAASIGAS
ncbi:ABC transporter substrate-binding protein [Desertihabitans brevis]|nr:extracellular solute-binding protein [Desertihabitans brevis]